MSPVYWMLLLLVFGLGNLAQNNPISVRTRNGQYSIRPDKGAVILLSFILISVSGLRYWVGTDYGTYYRWIVSDWPTIWSRIIQYKEGGFFLLVKLARTIWNDGQSVIFLSALITVGLYCWTIYKYSPIYLISILLYLFMGEWQGSFNGVRQYLAAAIVFAGHRFILERKLWQYCLVVFIAGMFHTTALIMILPYFLFTRKADITQMVLLAVGAVIVRFSYGLIFNLIGGYKGTVMNVAGDTYLSNSVNIFRILVAFVPVMIYVFLCRKERHTKEQVFYANATLFNAFSMLAGMGNTYLARIGIYTNAAVIIGYVYLLEVINDEKTRKISTFFIMVIYLLYWLYSIQASGIGNFRWFFGR